MPGGVAPDDRRKVERAALVSLLAALGLVGAKLAAGLASGSLAILSEAAHSGFDAAATALALVAIRIASRPPDREHPYGHGKAENIFALLEMAGLLLLAGYIAWEAVSRLRHGSVVEAAWYTFAVVLLSIVVDFSRARVLRRVGRLYRSPALEADALHFTADLATSSVVLAGLIAVRLGYQAADALGGLGVAAFVGFMSIRLGRRSIGVLMDQASPETLDRLTGAAAGVDGVSEVRRVRVRHAGGQPHADVVVAISRKVPLETAHQVSEEVEQAIREIEPGADVVVHVEPLADEKLLAERVTSIAAREPGVSQIHNVHVTQHRSGLHITLHAKFPDSMSLEEAHAISDRLEASIAAEVKGVSRVDTHLEPLEGTREAASDVTAFRQDLVASARAVAERLREVSDCHEVIVMESHGAPSIIMHCTAAPGLSVADVHNASTAIENEIHQLWPEVSRVTVHFEPLEGA